MINASLKGVLYLGGLVGGGLTMTSSFTPHVCFLHPHDTKDNYSTVCSSIAALGGGAIGVGTAYLINKIFLRLYPIYDNEIVGV